jgi:hypothetical protein
MANTDLAELAAPVTNTETFFISIEEAERKFLQNGSCLIFTA